MTEMLTALEGTGFAAWLRESGSIWAYPTVLTLHTVGLALLVGANSALDLRVLGAASAVPLSSLSRLFPVMWIGFVVNAVSGVLLFAADATTKGTTRIFVFKLGLIVLAVVLMWALKRVLYGDAGDVRRVGAPAKGIAIASIAVWVAAIAAGRFMAYV